MGIRVLLADDDALVREGLKVLLHADGRFEVVACVENGRQAVEACEARAVDVALLDARMPVLDGPGAARRIAAGGKTRPLILTTFDEDELVLEAIRAGARGYLLKSTPPDRIKEAIVTVASGQSVLQDAALERLKQHLAPSNAASHVDTGRFSDRELTVMRAIAEGLSNREVAERLYITEGTVKNIVSSVLEKTGLDHRTQIAIYYLTGKTPP
jgi:DNA-binding NarL/FixJ family response regulator